MNKCDLKIGEVEAMLDLLMAIEKKGQWQGQLEKRKSPHAAYFPSAIEKTISMFSAVLPFNVEPWEEK